MAKVFNLAEKFKIGGYWWLPGTPEKRIYGQLIYRPENVTELELEGSFKESLKDTFEYISSPLIYGETTNGISCTLVDAHEKPQTVHSSGNIASIFFCNKLFIGKELLDPDNALFESALVQFSDFSTWLSHNPFNVKYPDTKSSRRVYNVSYTMPNLITTPVKSINASIKFEPSITSGGENQAHKLVHSDEIRFIPKRKRDLKWYLDIIQKFRIFLSMLIGEPVNPISIRLCTKRRKLPHLGNKLYREYLDFCAPHYQSRKRRQLHYPDILFPYPLIQKDFGKHLSNWYLKSGELKTSFQLYFGVLLQTDMPLEFRYLALIQAIESYQRLKKPNRYMSPRAYEPIKSRLIKAISDTVTSDHRAALKARIKYGYEYSLRKRLNIILTLIPKSLQKKITNNDPKFVDKVVTTRNYLTHRDDSDKINVLDTKGILHASESLKLLLLILFLVEIEVDAMKIEHVILTNWRFRSIQRVK